MTSATVPEYTPGEWVAVVTPGRVAFVPPTTSAATVGRLWESMRAVDGPSLVDHLQVLAGGDLAAMPPFALLTVADARLHAVVRGTVEVAVTVGGRVRVLTAPHVSTWSEEVVEGVERVEVRAGDASSADAVCEDRALPLESGVVRASAVHVRVAVAGEPDREPGPDPDRELEPILEPERQRERWPAPEPGLVLAEAASAARPALRALATRGSGRSVATSVPSPALAVDGMLDDQPVDITLLRPAQPDAAAAPAADLRVDGGVTDRLSTGADVPTDTSVSSHTSVSTDHDGTTVLGHEVLALRRQLPEWTGHAVVAPLVTPAPATPTPARIALSTGEVVSLSRPVLLGRAPQASRISSSQVPRLVTVPSPLQDISRTHAEVRMDGDDVVLTDLRSTNGVLVVHPAGSPQRLQPGEATVLQPGVLVDLGEGVTFTVERGA